MAQTIECNEKRWKKAVVVAKGRVQVRLEEQLIGLDLGKISRPALSSSFVALVKSCDTHHNLLNLVQVMVSMFRGCSP